MLFNSLAFAVFLVVVLVAYWTLKNHKHQNLFLVGASLVFYGWWDVRFLSLIAISTCVDYACARAIGKEKKRGKTGRRWLLISLFANLGMLGVFKYLDFFISSTVPIWEALGWRVDLLHLILPVGISFYTFQTMAYTIDVYRGTFEARRRFIDVAAYVTFFPQLVAGPIEQPTNLFVQLEKPRSLTLAGLRIALLLMLMGYLKKVVLADGLAPVVEWTFGRLGMGQAVEPAHIALGSIAFSFQIYGDFSGYTDIARGVARLLGIELMINFRQPLFSRTHTEMWRRWHISLSQWLQSYLYFTLGGNRKGKVRTSINMMVTMLLGGLWHGAAWNFVSWGFLHGVYLLLEGAFGVKDPKNWPLPIKVLATLVTFTLFTFALMFFRCKDIGNAWFSVLQLFGPWSLPDPTVAGAVLLGALLVLIVDLPLMLHPKEEMPAATRPKWALLLMATAGVCFYMFPPGGSVTFFYFQF